MESPLADPPHSSVQMASLSCSPIRYGTGRQLLEGDGCNDNFSNCSKADVDDCIPLGNEQHSMHCSSPLLHICHFDGVDSMELSDFDAASSALDMGGEGEGDTIEEIMNTPHTTVMPVPVRDFSSLYAGDKSISDDVEQMRNHRGRIQEKLKEQLIAQESESKAATSIASTELYAPRDRYQEDENGVDNTDDPTSLDGEDTQGIKVETEYFCKMWWELDTLLNEFEPLTPSGDTERQTSASFPAQSLSVIELTSNSCKTLQAPNDLTPSATSSEKSIRSSRSSEFKAASSSKRRRKAAIEEAEAKEEAALKELEKYREMDLAPLEPIMESKIAGDLIVHGTPAKARDIEIFGRKYRTPEYKNTQTLPSQKPKRDVRAQLQTPPRCSMPLIERYQKHEADIQESDTALLNPNEHQAIPHAKHPLFINVIETLPATIFWCTTAAMQRCSMNAFDALVERLTGLRVKDVEPSSE